MNGRVVHFEVPFDDGDRARAFYQNAFGWEVTPMPEMSYTMVSTGPTGDQGPSESGYIGGGMMARDEVFRGPIITVAVDDIDEGQPRGAQVLGVEAGERGDAQDGGVRRVGRLVRGLEQARRDDPGVWRRPRHRDLDSRAGACAAHRGSAQHVRLSGAVLHQ